MNARVALTGLGYFTVAAIATGAAVVVIIVTALITGGTSIHEETQ